MTPSNRVLRRARHAHRIAVRSRAVGVKKAVVTLGGNALSGEALWPVMLPYAR